MTKTLTQMDIAKYYVKYINSWPVIIVKVYGD
jgi:hypothetical protein